MSGEVFKAQTVAAREANFHVDDSPRHAQFVLDYTQANTNIFLLSNNPGELQYNPRVFAIKGFNAKFANVSAVQKLLLSKTFSVAQY